MTRDRPTKTMSVVLAVDLADTIGAGAGAAAVARVVLGGARGTKCATAASFAIVSSE